MANENTITIKINADGSMAVNGVNQVTGSLKKMETDTQSIVSKFKEHWFGITAAITGALYTIKKAWDLAEQASQFQEQMTALNALSSQYGITSKMIVANIKEASGGLISMADAAHVAAKSLLEGMNPDQLIQFTRIVKETTNVTGDSVANSFERIGQAAAIGSERTLRQMGIIVDLQDAYKQYAKSIHVTVEQLSQEERQQIGLNAILAHGSEIIQRLGESTDSVNDKMERFLVMIKDLKLQVGDLLIRTGAAVIGLFHLIDMALVSTAKMFIDFFAIFEKGLNMLGYKRKDLQDLSSTLAATNEELYKGMIDSFNVTIAKSDELVTAQKGIATQAQVTHIYDRDREMKALADVMKALEDINRLKEQGNEIQRRGYEEAWNMIMNTNNIIGGQAGQGLSLAGSGLKGMMDMMSGGDIFSKQLSDMQDNYNAQIQATSDFYNKKLQLMSDSGMSEVAIRGQTAQMINDLTTTAHEYELQQDSVLVQQKLYSYAMMANMVQGVMVGLMSFMGKNNALMFYTQKLFAMANIIISTAMGVASCLANPALWPMIPWVEAMGAFQLAIVAAQTIMGAGKGVSTAGRGGGFALNNPTTASVQREESQKSQVINIYVQGNIVDHDTFARELIPSIQKATSDNVR